jgi:gas vesicle protein
MGSKKSFVKGLAAGAVLAAAASLIMDMREGKGQKAKALKKAATDIGGKVAVHAMRLGTLSKSAYAKVVDTAIAEYRGVKALSDEDLRDLKAELKGGWSDLKAIAKKKSAKKR